MVTINFQQGNGISRPNDTHPLLDTLPPVSSLADVPSIGDYIEFHSETGEEGVFKVISRFLRYRASDNKTSIFVNVVVEKQSDDVYGKLIKE